MLSFLFGWLVCWLRGWHRTPPDYGWQFFIGGFGIWCWTCGKEIQTGRDKARPYRGGGK